MANSPLDPKGQRVFRALRAAPFLRGVPDGRLEQLASSVSLRAVTEGEVVVKEGEFGQTMFLVAAGQFAVHGMDPDSRPAVLAHIAALGAHFGEAALLGRQRRSATVVCEGAGEVVELDQTRLERLDFVVGGGVIAALAQLSQSSALRAFIASHRFLREMGASGVERLVAGAQVVQYERGERIFREGDLTGTVILLRSGIAKRRRVQGDDESVLAYFNVGNIVGLLPVPRHDSDLIALGFVEGWAWRTADFVATRDAYPSLLERFQMEVSANATGGPSEPKTVIAFADAFAREGAQEGLSLLTINLDACVRCGNCVAACQDRYRYARVTRTGKKLVRRVDGARAGEHETILLPASCRHCANPECMIGCPTGAIHRKPGGEVDIEAFCIGCGSCAERCPYGNIQMVDTPGRRVGDVVWERIANKCNLCAGYENANCVHNCPTGAILRVEPTQFYPELAAVLGKVGQVAVGSSTLSSRPFWNRTLPTVVAGLTSAYLVVLRFIAPDPYEAGSPGGLILGVVTAIAMLAALGIGARRRVMRRSDHLGRLSTWTSIHQSVSWVFLVGLLVHSGPRLGGGLTATLFLATLAACATGALGWALYRWLPRTITRLEGDAQVEEAVHRQATQVAEQLRLLGGSPLGVALPSAFAMLRSGYSPEAARLAMTAALAGRPVEEGGAFAQRRALDQLRLHELNLCAGIYTVRRGWLLLHGGLSILVVALALVHMLAVWVIH